MTCGECLYYKNGECWRYPPTVQIESTQSYTNTGCTDILHKYTNMIPSVTIEHFCGEFKGKTKETRFGFISSSKSSVEELIVNDLKTKIKYQITSDENIMGCITILEDI